MIPWSTPFPLAVVLFLTACISISVAFANTALAPLFTNFSLDWWLGLSSWGWNHYYIWVFISHLFVHPSYGTLNLSYLIELALLLYTLWLMGSDLCERIGAWTFVVAYLTIGALAGALALALGPSGSLLEGPSASLLATLTLWTMLGPYSEILLFLIFPIQKRWLLVGIFASLCLVNVANGNWLFLIWYSMGILGGYFYGTMGWNFIGPFSWSSPLDQRLYYLSDGLKSFRDRLTRPSPGSTTSSAPKVFDFHTGQPILDDDDFVDAMLAKIAQHGERILSWNERKRLEEISARKREDKNF